MRINTNVSALNAQRLLGQTNNAVSSSMAKLSSGFRITRAADDAAGLAIANKFRNDIRSLGAASRNISEASSLVSIAEGATSSIADILTRMKELATQAASATSNSQLTTLDNEYQDMKNEIGRIAAGTEYQGTKLLDGTTTSLTVQIGSGTTANDKITVTLTELDALAVGDLTSQTNAQTAMGSLDTALGTVNGALASYGSDQNRLDFAQRNLQTQVQNYSASESVIRDVDMAKEMTSLSKNQILQQAGTAMLAQANQAAQGVLQLLR